MKKEELSVELDEGILTIKGESQPKTGVEVKEGEWDVLHSYIKELKKSSFVRRFTLPSDLSIDSIEDAEAELNDGILSVRFKDVYTKKEVETTVKDIPIK